MESTPVISAVTPKLKIVVLAEDGTEKNWTLCLDYRALARVEESTGLDLKKPDDWDKIKSGGTFPRIVWACLNRYSPDVTLDEVLDNLNPQAHAILWNKLYDFNFPGLREAVAAFRAKKKAESPNETPESKTT